ncbi:MAG: elongation factor Ts [Chitinophagales bacterium]|nr:elongation factor Ts [Chitinophagales bacterium]
MTITAKDVNELRKQTGAGLMDCKKALTESNGDLDAAIDYLRKKGQKVSQLRAGREAKEGVVIAKTSDDRKKGIVLQLSSETDFVARNQEFIDFASSLTDLAMSKGVKSIDELLDTDYDGATVKEKLSEKVGAIGENIQVAALEELEGELVVPYIHAGNKIGVLVAMNKSENGTSDLAKDVAMQIAAMNPIAIDESDVPETVKEREFQIGKEQAVAEGKPENIVEKIAEGKLKKYYKENTLLNQQFVKDGSKTVKEVLGEKNKELTIIGFKRVALG